MYLRPVTRAPIPPSPSRARGVTLTGKPTMNRLLLLLAITILTGCGELALSDPKTYDDLANTACELLAQEKAEEAKLQGISFADVHNAVKTACDTKENVQPWIDALLSTKAEQDAVMGHAMGVKQDEPEPEPE